jgi:hypothetical protein
MTLLCSSEAGKSTGFRLDTGMRRQEAYATTCWRFAPFEPSLRLAVATLGGESWNHRLKVNKVKAANFRRNATGELINWTS